MHQNVDYYGLSEIRFYKKTVVSVQSLGKLDDISFVAGQGYLKSAEGPKREFLLRFNTPLYAGATLTCQLGDKIWNAEIEASKTGVISVVISGSGIWGMMRTVQDPCHRDLYGMWAVIEQELPILIFIPIVCLIKVNVMWD